VRWALTMMRRVNGFTAAALLSNLIGSAWTRAPRSISWESYVGAELSGAAMPEVPDTTGQPRSPGPKGSDILKVRSD
jgi:hypothetical protein